MVKFDRGCFAVYCSYCSDVTRYDFTRNTRRISSLEGTGWIFMQTISRLLQFTELNHTFG